MSIPLNKSGTAGDLGLSLTGMRIAPRDPTTHVAKVGIKQEVYKPEHSLGSLQARIMKERTGFSGGFKIPEEYRKSKIKKKGLLSDNEQEEDLEATQQSHITKDEIFQQLNLGHSDSGIGVGKHGTNSKQALAKDLVEGIEKDLEKLKRQQENLQLRKQLALTGQSVVEETAEEKFNEQKFKLRSELESAGTHVIAASPRKLQVMRHQGSQLASIKNLELDELEEMRMENERRLKELEALYSRKKENSGVGRIIRDRMGFSAADRTTPRDNKEADFDRDDEQDEHHPNHNGGGGANSAKKKKVRIVDEKEKENVFENNLLGKNSNKDLRAVSGKSNSHLPRGPSLTKEYKTTVSRSASRKREDSPIQYDSPRRKLYEAKFEKFISNKDQKVKQEKKLEKYSKEDFDRYTKGPESPAKSSKRFQRGNSQSKFEPDSLIPQDYDEVLLLKKEEEMRKSQLKKQTDPFLRMGVSNEDKMTFFLLKWIFNAIKRDSSHEDPKLKGRSYVTKSDLIKQLSKNEELMSALGYHSADQVSHAVKQSGSAKDGCLLWEEFLDFFFLRQASLQERMDGDNWWKRIGNSEQKQGGGHHMETEHSVGEKQDHSPQKNQANVPRYMSGQQVQPYFSHENPDRKPVKMTESLKILQETRQHRITEEVEQEFKLVQDKKHQDKLAQKAAQQSGTKKKPVTTEWTQDHEDDLMLEEQFGIKREKSQCLLLQSQIFIMQEIFEALDKYNDAILRRNQFIMALRTDERIVEFIDADAVKVPYSQRILTLDEVLVEVEKDELFEMTQIGKSTNQINHKEFITWREFMTYFNDYKDIEERNRKMKEIQRTRSAMQKERQNTTEGSSEQGIEIASLMDKEKQRRLQELPKLRPADQIDISEKQLQLLRDIYDSLPKATGAKDTINTIDFFIATRKNPQLRAISSAIARDPEGTSRIPRETFQQVFDRMENELQSKQLDWPTIVEYFTKRGRPLTKDEVVRLIEDDRREREEEEYKKRQEEEAERRRMTRLMEDLEDKEDYEEFEMRQKSEQAAKILQEKRFEKKNDTEDEWDEDYGDEDIDRDQDGYGGYMSDPELRTAQRTVKFSGDGYGSTQKKNNRAQSAHRKGRNNFDSGKSFDERDLRNVKLSNKDYIDHERSQSRKKGKYGITVPKPFAFDAREKTRSKTIREKKVEEMIAEKKLEEENIIKHQFRHNPIPPEVLIPRYKTIVESNEMRRLEVKKNSIAITKQKEMPFSFYERDKFKQKADPEEYLPRDLKNPSFKANPIPRACSVLIFDQMMKKQEQDRQERIRKQAELNFSKAKLPDRMQMHSEKTKQQPYKKTEVDSYSFKPQINDLVTREQFKKAQDKFNQKLNKKKSQMHVTEPRSPNFTKTSSKTLDRAYLNEGQQQAPVMDKFKAALMKNMASIADEKNVQNPSSTKSMNLVNKRRREELEAKRKAEEQVKKEDKERFERQNQMKTIVQAALKDRIKDDTEKQKNQIEQKKKQMRESEKETKALIQKRIDNARSRPLLIDSLHSKKNAENLAKLKVTKEYVEILQESGINPNQHLSEEQKELLAADKEMENIKKMMGKK